MPKPKKTNPGDVIAIGDIHARYDCLEAMLQRLKGTGARVILLGDLIDRGGEDVKVLDRVKGLLDDPESLGLESFYVLMGNHERMFLDVVHHTHCRNQYHLPPMTILYR